MAVAAGDDDCIIMNLASMGYDSLTLNIVNTIMVMMGKAINFTEIILDRSNFIGVLLNDIAPNVAPRINIASGMVSSPIKPM